MISINKIQLVSFQVKSLGFFVMTCLFNSCCEKSHLIPPESEISSSIFLTSTSAVIRGSVNAHSSSPTIYTFSAGNTASCDQYDYQFNIAQGYLSYTPGMTHYVFCALKDLSPETTYYYKLSVSNSGGTAVSSVNSFTTLKVGESIISFNPDLSYGTLSDIEGNEYKTIQIGMQIWMVENLRTTKLNDGTGITRRAVKPDYGYNYNKPEYTWLNNDSAAFCLSVGALYNWLSVNTGKLCPAGWHVPSADEWDKLYNYIGGNAESLGKLVETGKSHWPSQNSSGTNSSGFTALPCYMGPAPDMSLDNWSAARWLTSSPENDVYYCKSIGLRYNPGYNNWTLSKTHIYELISVRCIKN